MLGIIILGSISNGWRENLYFAMMLLNHIQHLNEIYLLHSITRSINS